MPYNGPITQHEDYAITGKAPQDIDFGVLPHNHKNKPNSEPKVHRKKALADGERGIPGPRSYHPEPNHGPTKSP